MRLPDEGPLPFECPPEVGEAWILRVKPSKFIQDPFELDQQHLAVWLIEEAMGDRVRKRLRSVHRRIAQWSEECWGIDSRIALVAGIYERRTPFAVGWSLPQSSLSLNMIVMWRGEYFARSRNGVLTSTGDRVGFSGIGRWPR